jgi:hypothetical protein
MRRPRKQPCRRSLGVGTGRTDPGNDLPSPDYPAASASESPSLCGHQGTWEALGSEVHLGPFRLSAKSAFHLPAASGAVSLNLAPNLPSVPGGLVH